MTKTELFHQLLKKGNVANKVLFRPILMQFAAEYIGSNYGSFASDFKVLVEANLRCLDDFDLDMLGLISDPYRETSAFGARIEYVPDGVPRCLDLVVNTLDDVIDLKNPDTKIPAFFLQPAIENVLRHGWREDGSPINISIDLFENEQGIQVTIIDDGRGIDPQRLKQLPIKNHALANILDRLKLMYKKDDLLSISSEPDKGTKVEIIIPKVRS